MRTLQDFWRARWGFLLIAIVITSITIILVSELKQTSCKRYDSQFEICDTTPLHGMRFETDNMNIKFILHNNEDMERQYLIVPSIVSISEPSRLVEQPFNYTVTIPSHGKEEWSYLDSLEPGRWRVTVNMVMLTNTVPKIADKQTSNLPEESASEGIYVKEIVSYFVESNSSSISRSFLVQSVDNYYTLMITIATMVGSIVTAAALGVQIASNLSHSKKLQEQIQVQREELKLEKDRLTFESDLHVKENEESRKQNLSDHCHRLMLNSNLEKNYPLLLKEISSENLDLHKYKHLILEHLYTGHKELYDLVLSIPKLTSIANSRNSEYFDKIRKSIRAVGEELGFPEESSRKEADPRFDEIEVAHNIFHQSGKQEWRDITYKVRGSPLNECYLVQSNGIQNTVHNATEEKVKQLVVRLNEIAHDSILCGELDVHRKAQETDNAARAAFDKWFKELLISIDSGTAILGGACRNCLSSEYHNENDLVRFRVLLSELK